MDIYSPGFVAYIIYMRMYMRYMVRRGNNCGILIHNQKLYIYDACVTARAREQFMRSLRGHILRRRRLYIYIVYLYMVTARIIVATEMRRGRNSAARERSKKCKIRTNDICLSRESRLNTAAPRRRVDDGNTLRRRRSIIRKMCARLLRRNKPRC